MREVKINREPITFSFDMEGLLEDLARSLYENYLNPFADKNNLTDKEYYELETAVATALIDQIGKDYGIDIYIVDTKPYRE